MSKFNPYETLGVSKEATPEEIKKAFKKEAKKTHPDAGGNPDDFNDTRRAMAILSDPKRRERYDRTGNDEETVEDRASIRIIAELVEAVAEHDDFDVTDDLVEIMKKLINERIAKITIGIGGLKAKVNRQNKLLKRFKKKNKNSEKSDLIGAMFKSKIIDLEEAIRDLEKQKSDHKEAHSIVSDYEFETEKPENGPNYGGFTSNSSRMWGKTFYGE